MSLQVWLPLNGDLRNQGIKPITLSSSSTTLDSSGKLGKCYSFNGSTSYVSMTLLDMFKGGSNPFSICFWIYSNESGTRGVIFGDWNLPGTSNFNIEVNHSSCTTNQMRFYWNDGYPDYTVPNLVITPGEWMHVMVIYDGSKLEFYKNNTLVNTRTGTLVSVNKTSGAFRLGRDSRSSSEAFSGKLNDFRIYNHVLSDRERSEIFKGLMLHYPLHTNLYSITQNNYTSLINTSNASVSGSRITISKGNDGWGYGGITSKIAYRTGYVKATIGQANRYAMIGFASINTSYNYTQGYFVYPAADATVHIYEMGSHIGQVTTYSTGDTFEVIYNGSTITYFKNGVALRSVSVSGNMYMNITTYTAAATILNNVTFGELSRTECDASGFKHDAGWVNTPKIAYSNDRQKYFYQMNSSYLNANTAITKTDGMPLTTAGWFYQTGRSGYQFLFGNRANNDYNWMMYTHKTDGSIQLHGNTQYKSNIIPTLNTWHHVAAVVYPNKTYSLWLDGQKVVSNLSFNYHVGSPNHFGVGAWDGNEQFQGQLADVRVYATALSDADVVELYNTSATIDNKGNVYCREVVEVG